MIILSPWSHAHSKRGGSLLLVLLVTFAMSILVASLLNVLINDKRMNRRINLMDDARNAAEGLVEVGVAEINRRAASFSSMPTDVLSGYSVPVDMRTFLASAGVASSSLELKPGQLSPLSKRPVVINGDDPFNLPDADKGKPVVLRHAFLYGRATANDPVTGQAATSYVSNLVQIREQTWLNYAIFFNLDLEMHSGSNMDITGPVHSNQSVFATAGSGASLEFYGSLTTPKKILRMYKYGGAVTHTGDVLFPPKEAPSASDLRTMSMLQDSAMSSFKDFAETRWKGFVQDSTFDVPVFNPPGMLQYVQDDHTTVANEMRNHAYAMIEPQLAEVVTDNAGTNTYAGYKGDGVENMKFSALAGLTIRVKPAGSWPGLFTTVDPGFELVYYTGIDPSRPVSRDNPPRRDAITRQPTETVINLARMNLALLATLTDAVKIVKYEETTPTSPGNSALKSVLSGSSARYGIYDRRQGYQGSSSNNGRMGAHHAVHVDLEKFDLFLNASAASWIDITNPLATVYSPQTSYSGIVYVQLPLVPISDSAVSARKTTDRIRPAVGPTTTTPGYAVILRNGTKLPALPADPSKRDEGFTFATNAPLYIMGNYNADGAAGTGSSTAPDHTPPASVMEMPALVAADAVTLLSSQYTDTNMRDSALTLANAGFTEVSAAIIAGIVPTRLNASGNGTNNQWAGGVHNYVRFLENWTGTTYRYRGSAVCLFENEVSRGPWYQSVFTYWYRFPSRDVGYHDYFAGGRFPPGVPVMRTVRKISVSDITAQQYAAGPPTPPAAAN